jgi:hypothetical protein
VRGMTAAVPILTRDTIGRMTRPAMPWLLQTTQTGRLLMSWAGATRPFPARGMVSARCARTAYKICQFWRRVEVHSVGRGCFAEHLLSSSSGSLDNQEDSRTFATLSAN